MPHSEIRMYKAAIQKNVRSVTHTGHGISGGADTGNVKGTGEGEGAVNMSSSERSTNKSSAASPAFSCISVRSDNDGCIIM